VAHAQGIKDSPLPELEESNPAAPAQSEEELWHAASLASPVRSVMPNKRVHYKG